MPEARVSERCFDTVAAMADHLAAEVSSRLRTAVEERGGALIAVSGGRFSRHLFEAMSGHRLPWPRITLVLADERWVDRDDDLSNEKLVRDHLLQGTAADARLLGLKGSGVRPEDDQAGIEATLAALPFPFDLVLLGMGDDGHTASLFPSAPADELKRALVAPDGARVAVIHPPVSTVTRVTLTLPTLLHARRIVLHIPGRSKLATYRQAMQAGPIEAMPVRGILRQQTVPVDVLTCEREEP